jgi:hypothetical protein
MPFFFRLIQRISRQKPQLFKIDTSRFQALDGFAKRANAPKVGA